MDTRLLSMKTLQNVAVSPIPIYTFETSAPSTVFAATKQPSKIASHNFFAQLQVSSLFLFALSLHGSKLGNADGLMLDEAYIINFWFHYSLFFSHNGSIFSTLSILSQGCTSRQNISLFFFA